MTFIPTTKKISDTCRLAMRVSDKFINSAFEYVQERWITNFDPPHFSITIALNQRGNGLKARI